MVKIVSVTIIIVMAIPIIKIIFQDYKNSFTGVKKYFIGDFVLWLQINQQINLAVVAITAIIIISKTVTSEIITKLNLEMEN